MVSNAPQLTVSNRPAGSLGDRDSITATEAINGVLYQVVLERDDRGLYREVHYTPLERLGITHRSAIESSDIDASNYLG